MLLIFLILILVSLAIMFWQDLKYRKISIFLPLIIFISSTVSGTIKLGAKFIWSTAIYNSLFFGLTIGLLTLYVSIKKREFTNPLKESFGIGDILYFVSITPILILTSYILNFIASLLFAVLLQYFFIKNPSRETVPLAGFAALLLLFNICMNKILNIPTGIIL